MSETSPAYKLSVIIPAYLEEKNILPTLNSLRVYFRNQPYDVEFIVVDDGSTDKTSEQAQKNGAKVITFPENRGKGAAVRAGMLEGKGEYLLFTDADYPYDIRAVEDCIRLLDGGADLVIGSRNIAGSDRGRERAKRRLISKVGNLIAQLFILPGISDTQAGFKCFRRDAARRIFSLTVVDGWGFDIEALYIARLLRLKIKEAPIRLIPRAIKPSRIQSPTRTAINVFGSIFTIHKNRLSGKYKEK